MVGLADVAGEWGAFPGSVWLAVDWTYLGIQAVTGIVFMRWLWLARTNAKVIEPAPHRHSPMWAVLCWIVPIVGFWFPQMVVRDVWNASNPQRPRGAGQLYPTPGAELISWWWAAFLANQVLSTIGARHSLMRPRDPLGSFPVSLDSPGCHIPGPGAGFEAHEGCTHPRGGSRALRHRSAA
ncbi:DUF4328 domain-containing protein [Amycolatopsis sp., V23-08]|uniref:DUF4328 domain-containing protein n=1 Tax=Amycolatopsis heterodermiae TaxID=3110235 RepID=A0ABU5R416_9PSEU|nr:DUF4328 domain-containing protein [Amycolatopsis sp., V23-08]MEA5360962.1 DUF4328 domain-containing protein [Amycolatopsis sp., V23-08]